MIPTGFTAPPARHSSEPAMTSERKSIRNRMDSLLRRFFKPLGKVVSAPFIWLKQIFTKLAAPYQQFFTEKVEDVPFDEAFERGLEGWNERRASYPRPAEAHPALFAVFRPDGHALAVVRPPNRTLPANPHRSLFPRRTGHLRTGRDHGFDPAWHWSARCSSRCPTSCSRRTCSPPRG